MNRADTVAEPILCFDLEKVKVELAPTGEDGWTFLPYIVLVVIPGLDPSKYDEE